MMTDVLPAVIRFPDEHIQNTNPSKMHTEINPKLEGVAQLGEGVTFTSRRTLHGEAVILRVSQIAYPQADVQRTEIGIGMGTKYRIKILTDCILLIPVGLALCREVHPHGDAAQMEAAGRIEQGCRVNINPIVGTCPQRMLWNERHPLVFLIDGPTARNRICIFIKESTCEAIAKGIHEPVVQCASPKSRLQTA